MRLLPRAVQCNAGHLGVLAGSTFSTQTAVHNHITTSRWKARWWLHLLLGGIKGRLAQRREAESGAMCAGSLAPVNALQTEKMVLEVYCYFLQCC